MKWWNPKTWFAPRPPAVLPRPKLDLPASKYVLPLGPRLHQGFLGACTAATFRGMMDSSALVQGGRGGRGPSMDEIYAACKEPGFNAPTDPRRVMAYLSRLELIDEAASVFVGTQRGEPRWMDAQHALRRMYRDGCPVGVWTTWPDGMKTPWDLRIATPLGLRPLGEWKGRVERGRAHTFFVHGWFHHEAWGRLLLCRSSDDAGDFVITEQTFGTMCNVADPAHEAILWTLMVRVR
jgi:hypothetical protein